nr:InlB B-repeat-containing protein [Lachnospiraceae bacterium]
KTGYIFAGWALSASGNKAYGDAATVVNLTGTNNGTVNLYAKWTPITYEIDYHTNGGSGSMNNSVCTYDVSMNLSSNKFTKTGYLFAGWALSSTGNPVYNDGATVKNLTATNNGTAHLYAKWTPITYNVIYNANGGSGSISNTVCTYDVSTNLTANSFTRTGYTFSGWSTSANGSVVYANKAGIKNLSAANNGKVTLYAVWTPVKYKISFDSNKPSSASSDISGSMSNQELTYNVSANLNAVGYKLPGYEFKGWSNVKSGGSVVYSDKASVKNLSSSSGSNVTLYARWSPVKTKVTVNFAIQNIEGEEKFVKKELYYNSDARYNAKVFIENSGIIYDDEMFYIKAFEAEKDTGANVNNYGYALIDADGTAVYNMKIYRHYILKDSMVYIKEDGTVTEDSEDEDEDAKEIKGQELTVNDSNNITGLIENIEDGLIDKDSIIKIVIGENFKIEDMDKLAELLSLLNSIKIIKSDNQDYLISEDGKMILDSTGKNLIKVLNTAKDIDLSGLETIGTYAFRDYDGDKIITVPESVKEIEIDAFKGCISDKLILNDDININRESGECLGTGMIYGAENSNSKLYTDYAHSVGNSDVNFTAISGGVTDSAGLTYKLVYLYDEESKYENVTEADNIKNAENTVNKGESENTESSEATGTDKTTKTNENTETGEVTESNKDNETSDAVDTDDIMIQVVGIHDEAEILECKYIKEGYSFKEWKALDKSYLPGDKIYELGKYGDEIILTAVWEKDPEEEKEDSDVATGDSVDSGNESEIDTGDTGSGTGDTGNGAGDSESGTGDTGNGTGDTGSGAGDSESGTGDTGNGTGDSGSGTGDTGNSSGVSDSSMGDTGNISGESGSITEDTIKGTGDSNSSTAGTDGDTGVSGSVTGDNGNNKDGSNGGTGESDSNIGDNGNSAGDSNSSTGEKEGSTEKTDSSTGDKSKDNDSGSENSDKSTGETDENNNSSIHEGDAYNSNIKVNGDNISIASGNAVNSTSSAVSITSSSAVYNNEIANNSSTVIMVKKLKLGRGELININDASVSQIDLPENSKICVKVTKTKKGYNIQGLRKGTTKIKLTASDGSKRIITVEVFKAPKKIKCKNIKIKKSKSRKINVKFNTKAWSNALEYIVTKGKDVIGLKKKGLHNCKLKAKKKGKAEIKIIAFNGCSKVVSVKVK